MQKTAHNVATFKKMYIFVPWFRKRLRHRGEQLSFDPSENLENSSDRGKSLKSESHRSPRVRNV